MTAGKTGRQIIGWISKPPKKKKKVVKDKNRPKTKPKNISSQKL